MKFLSDGILDDAEKLHLAGHDERIRALFARLIPRQSLDWVAVLVRIGIAMILFFILIAPPYTYYRAQYLAPPGIVQSSASGTVSVREYAPEIPVSMASPLWRRRDVSGVVSLTHSEDFRGMTAGIAQHGEGEHPGVAVFWTAPEGKKRVLRKAVTDEFFRPNTTHISTLWDDQDFESAVVATHATTSLVAAAYRSADGARVALQSFDVNGTAFFPRVEIGVQDRELIDEIQAVPWGTGWALSTRIPRSPDASLFDPTVVKVRVLDQALHVTDTFELPISGYEIGAFPIVRQTPGGYAVIATAHPSVRASTEPVGDRLYGFQFSASKKLNRVLRLTNVGGQHDFWTTGFTTTDQGDIAVGVQNIYGYGFDDPTVPYPADSGRTFLRFFDQAFQMAGSIIVFDEAVARGQPDQRGASHLRQTMIGDRMYVAFDMINMESSETDAPDRAVQAMWLRVAR